jgi:hypothetical protein
LWFNPVSDCVLLTDTRGFNKIKKLNEKKEESCKGVESNNEELKKLEEN